MFPSKKNRGITSKSQTMDSNDETNASKPVSERTVNEEVSSAPSTIKAQQNISENRIIASSSFSESANNLLSFRRLLLELPNDPEDEVLIIKFATREVENFVAAILRSQLWAVLTLIPEPYSRPISRTPRKPSTQLIHLDDFSKRLYEFINVERRVYGLQKLEWSQLLHNIAHTSNVTDKSTNRNLKQFIVRIDSNHMSWVLYRPISEDDRQKILRGRKLWSPHFTIMKTIREQWEGGCTFVMDPTNKHIGIDIHGNLFGYRATVVVARRLPQFSSPAIQH